MRSLPMSSVLCRLAPPALGRTLTTMLLDRCCCSLGATTGTGYTLDAVLLLVLLWGLPRWLGRSLPQLMALTLPEFVQPVLLSSTMCLKLLAGPRPSAWRGHLPLLRPQTLWLLGASCSCF